MYASWRGYAYFCRENDPSGGFAAVPFSEKGGYKADGRQFSPEGLPVCAAGLVMPLAFTYTDRTTCLVEHERGKYTCPLPRGRGGRVACPIRHKNAKRGGCTAMTLAPARKCRCAHQHRRPLALHPRPPQ